MGSDKIFAAVFSIFGIIFTYWFFLTKKENIVNAKDSVDITVEGGYTPNTIIIPFNKSTIINFYRKDSSSCLEEVVIPDFKIRKFLPLNQKVTIELTPKQKGEFRYSCGMNMYHGKIIIK